MLWIHGLLGYSFSWRLNFPAFQNFRTSYAPDLLGTGFSERPPNLNCAMRAQAERMLDFMDRAGIESADLVGTSHGGAVSVFMAALQPNRFRKLVLVAPVNPWSAHGRLLTRMFGSRIGGAAFTRMAKRNLWTTALFLRRIYGDPKRIPRDAVDGYKSALRLAGCFDYGAKICSTWNRDLRDLATAYERITSPTMVIFGDRDPAVYASSGKEIVKRVPGAQLKILTGAGHMPYEEVPDEFNRILKSFLQ